MCASMVPKGVLNLVLEFALVRLDVFNTIVEFFHNPLLRLLAAFCLLLDVRESNKRIRQTN
jgi:hypothetical protein